MNYNFGGIKDLNGRPGALFVVDILEEANAVKEATKLGIPVVAMVDTNADPSKVAYPVPATDDAIKSIEIITGYVTAAVSAGRAEHAKKNVNKEEGGKE